MAHQIDGLQQLEAKAILVPFAFFYSLKFTLVVSGRYFSLSLYFINHFFNFFFTEDLERQPVTGRIKKNNPCLGECFFNTNLIGFYY